jgi:predicted branched-subunit amino acid permease
MYLNWQLWCLVGLLMGSRIPDASGWGLDVAMPITFIGMILPFVKSAPMAVCVLTAGAAALATVGFPYKLGILIAAFAGIGAGMAAEKFSRAREEAPRP